jgi:hypothetical protein
MLILQPGWKIDFMDRQSLSRGAGEEFQMTYVQITRLLSADRGMGYRGMVLDSFIISLMAFPPF